MGQPYIASQILPCLVAAPMRDSCPHPHEDLCPHLSVLKKICFKAAKSGNSTHEHTPQLKIQSTSPRRQATLLLRANIFNCRHSHTMPLSDWDSGAVGSFRRKTRHNNCVIHVSWSQITHCQIANKLVICCKAEVISETVLYGFIDSVSAHIPGKDSAPSSSKNHCQYPGDARGFPHYPKAI